jgi:DNA-binding CsgD family transcriptional regulator/ketosteroid isomerase-like protein
VSPDDLAGATEVLDHWFAAFNRHDVEALCEMADRNIEVIPLGVAETAPPGTSYHGHAGLRTVLSAGFARFPRMRLHHTPPRANGTHVTVDLEFLLDDGVAPAEIRTAGCTYRISGGRIARMRALEGADSPGDGRTLSRAHALSPREREVLSMLASGRTVAEIAEELVLSPFTVRTHVRNAKDKLQARTTPHAIAIALDEKVLDV